MKRNHIKILCLAYPIIMILPVSGKASGVFIMRNNHVGYSMKVVGTFTKTDPDSQIFISKKKQAEFFMNDRINEVVSLPWTTKSKETEQLLNLEKIDIYIEGKILSVGAHVTKGNSGRLSLDLKESSEKYNIKPSIYLTSDCFEESIRPICQLKIKKRQK